MKGVWEGRDETREREGESNVQDMEKMKKK